MRFLAHSVQSSLTKNSTEHKVCYNNLYFQLTSQLLHWVIIEDITNHPHSFVDTEWLRIVAFTCYNSSTFLPSKKNYILMTFLGYEPQPFIPHSVTLLTHLITNTKWLQLTDYGSCLVPLCKIHMDILYWWISCWTIPVLQSHETKADNLCDINLRGPIASSNATKHTTFMFETCLLPANYCLHRFTFPVNYSLCWFGWSHFISSTGILLPEKKGVTRITSAADSVLWSLAVKVVPISQQFTSATYVLAYK